MFVKMMRDNIQCIHNIPEDDDETVLLEVLEDVISLAHAFTTKSLATMSSGLSVKRVSLNP